MSVRPLFIIFLILMAFNTQCGRVEKEKMNAAQVEFPNLNDANTITYESFYDTKPHVKFKKIALKKSTRSWEFHEISEYSFEDKSVLDYLSIHRERSISIDQKEMDKLLNALAQIPKAKYFALSCDLNAWGVLSVGLKSSGGSCNHEPEKFAAIDILFDLAEKYKNLILSNQPE